MKKTFEHKKVSINDIIYTLQMVTANWYFSMIERCKDDNGNVIMNRYYNEMLENVVIDPRLSMEDFTSKIWVLRALIKECESFVMGDKESVTVKNVQKPLDIEPENEQN